MLGSVRDGSGSAVIARRRGATPGTAGKPWLVMAGQGTVRRGSLGALGGARQGVFRQARRRKAGLGLVRLGRLRQVCCGLLGMGPAWQSTRGQVWRRTVRWFRQSRMATHGGYGGAGTVWRGQLRRVGACYRRLGCARRSKDRQRTAGESENLKLKCTILNRRSTCSRSDSY